VQQQVSDTGLYDTLLMPNTVTPTHRLEFDGQTGAFTEGETLTGPSGSAKIARVDDRGTTGRLWLYDLTGTFTDNQAITDGDTGAATANGAVQSAGCGALWVQNTIAAVTAGPCAATDFFGELRPATLTSRKVGAFQGPL
jgi:hypothetical protein